MKKLSLASETLAELTDEQLTAVNGAALPTTPVTECYGRLFTHHSAVDCLSDDLCS